MKILFLSYAPRINASSRYRIYKYLRYFNKDEITTKVCPPVNDKIYSIFYKYIMNKKGVLIKFIYYFLFVLPNRLLHLFLAKKYDLVVVQRELFPYGNAYLERLLSRINKNIIFDFDDAIFTKPEHFKDKNTLKSVVKRFINGEDPVKTKIALSKYVIVGNEYLYDYARKINKNVVIIPTSIDFEEYIPEDRPTNNPLVIGWIGNPANLYYLKFLEPVLTKLSEKYEFILRVVSSKPFNSNNFLVHNKPWKEKDEIKDINSFDIGIMPLEDNEYTRGKGGFKIIQYMGLEKPTIASPVGINSKIIKDGVNGFLASNEQEWYEKLELLIKDAELRKQLGRLGRLSIINNFSIKENYLIMRNLFKEIIQGVEK